MLAMLLQLLYGEGPPAAKMRCNLTLLWCVCSAIEDTV
jgi:hypothetical protein